MSVFVHHKNQFTTVCLVWKGLKNTRDPQTSSQWLWCQISACCALRVVPESSLNKDSSSVQCSLPCVFADPSFMLHKHSHSHHFDKETEVSFIIFSPCSFCLFWFSGESSDLMINSKELFADSYLIFLHPQLTLCPLQISRKSKTVLLLAEFCSELRPIVFILKV